MSSTAPYTLYLDAECFVRPFGGVAKATWHLYNAFCPRYADQFKVVAVRRPEPYQQPLPQGMHDCVLGWGPLRDLWRASTLPPFLWMPPLPHMHFPNNGRIPVGIPRGKAITTLHDVLPLEVEGYLSPEKEARYRRKTQRYIDQSAMVMTVSAYSKAQILRHFTMTKDLVVIPNAPTLPPRPRETALSLEETKPYFLYTGRYEARKGIDVAIEAFLALHESGRSQTPLWMTGKAKYYNADFERLVKRATEKGVVKELGYVSDERLATLMHESRGLVYLSRSEGFGLPPLEAMNQACPVITTALTAMPEACGDAVYYVNPDDLAAVENAILLLDRDATLRQTFIEKGFEQAKRFSWEASADLFAAALRREVFDKGSST
ncbi:MAG: glycosyltransferase family 4 protein [Vampirovibrio sp.]